MRLRVTLTLVFAGAVAAAAVASASSFYAVKRGGLWYWSSNIPAALLAPPAPADGNATWWRHADTSELVKGLGLTRDETLELRAQLAQVALTGTPPVIAKLGFVPTSTACRGSRPSIASPEITVDLYHRFACTMRGASYKRLPAFQDAIKKARAAVAAAPSPKPQGLLDALVTAYAKRSNYLIHGDPKLLRFTLIVTGRRAYAVSQ
jgi:hypothetical protein